MINHKNEGVPQVVLAAPKSGCGKTMAACGLLELLKRKGFRPAAFKCGPDFIDPMFHTRVLGIPSRNLDSWFTGKNETRALYASALQKAGADIAVTEGVMGYYDGAGMTTTASTYELAGVLGAPVLLVVDAAGIGNSLAAYIKGYLSYKSPSGIAGILLNQISPGMYPSYKKLLEKETGGLVRVLGYLPRLPRAGIESRHLGLKLPGEITDLQSRIGTIADQLEETLDWQAFWEMATSRPFYLPGESDDFPKSGQLEPGQRVRIGIARDEAFCFYYQENLELLEEFGAELVPFSPLHSEGLPEGIGGALFGGGYPELYKEQLSKNRRFLEDVRRRLADGLPYLAECGGFLYLKESLDGIPMAGVLPGKGFATGRLSRFGYVELTAQRNSILGAAGLTLKGHEFHYFDTTDNGDAFYAKKPFGSRGWECIQAGERFVAGFAHLYFPSNPKAAKNFLSACRSYAGCERSD